MSRKGVPKILSRVLVLCLTVAMMMSTLLPYEVLASTMKAAENTIVVDDADPAITYSGWNLWKDGDYTQHYSTTVGSTITYTFTGTGIDLYCDKVSNGPIVTVSIDGKTEDADQYAPEKQSDARFYSKQGLKDKEHTVVITLTERSNPLAAPIGGGSLQATLTYLVVTQGEGEEEPLPPLPEEKETVTVEDTDPAVTYSPQWSLWTDEFGTQHYSRSVGSTVSYSFIGTGVEIFGDKVYNAPILNVAIDDEDYTEADQYAASKERDTSFYSRQDLPYADTP